MRRVSHSGHVPDLQMIPRALAGLDWQPMAVENEWNDGDELLVAVPVCQQRTPKVWRYEFSVVTIDCSDLYIGVDCEGDRWGWELSDADFYVRFR